MSNRSPGSYKNLVVAARSALIRNARELNLFSDNPFWSPALNNTEQILSTRLFLLFILISLLIVLTYASLIIRTHSITLDRFSLSNFEQLQTHYPNTLQVACSQVSNPYYKFIQLSPIFHEICSSSFIGNKWISSLFLPNATSHNILDFRTFIFGQFQALALLCQTAKQSVHDGHRTFNSTNLITHDLLLRAEFNEIANVLIENLRNTVLAKENRTARVVSMSIAQNRVMSALRTNFYIKSVYLSKVFVTYNGYYFKNNGTSLSVCTCRLQGNQCVYPAGAFYNWTTPELDQPAKSNPPPRFQIPGLMAGCLPLDSIRQSTLECFYNQSCINILSLQPNISRPKALRKSSLKFPRNSTIGSMFDKSLFVESWQTKSSFEDYFAACAPRSLTYSYQSRFHLPSIFTFCISTFGGLVIIWQLITPAIVKIWNLIKWKNKQRQSDIPSHQTEIDQTTTKPINKSLTSYVHRMAYTFNLFPPDDANDLEEQKIGIIATRLYILFLFIGLLILGFYTSLSHRTQTHIITSPSLIEFEQLESLYSSTLVCSCSRFSMSYNRIMSISPQYHQICSSQFLQESWLSYFDMKEIKLNSTLFSVVDFRFSGRSFFTLTRVLCRTAKETIENAIHLYRSRRLVTANTLSRTQFNDETQSRLNQFKKETITSFVNLLDLIRSSIQTNRLVTDLLTATGFAYTFNNQTLKWSPRFYSRNIGTCSCAFSSQCARPQGFYLQSDDSNSEPKVIIPGIVLGCYTIDSVLLSTLECLFEQKCVKLLIDMYDFDAVGLFHPLNSRAARIQPLRKENTRFPPNTTLESIISELFVEDWNTSKNFTAYYDRCAPNECSYSLTRRFDRVYMVAMMLGFYSGLSAILEIILPILVRFVKQRWKKQQRNTSGSEITDATVHSSTQTNNSRSFSEVYQSFRSLNLFSTELSQTNNQMRHQEIIATRIYIILFVATIIVALLYAGPFHQETTTTVINFPTSDIVNDLHTKNLSTLSCSCSNAAIRHSKFLSIIPRYHSICSSIYIKPSYWMDLSEKGDKVSTLLSTHYRVLASLCQTADRTIKSALDVFNSHELITVEPMTRSSFFLQTQALISTFISQIPADYHRTIKFITRSFGVNQLLNVFTSNWKLEFTNEDEQHIIATYPRHFSSSNCTCATSFDCTEQVTETIVSGCFPFDGFRLSKFKNRSLGQLNDRLFVTKWQNKTNYTAYFQACHPLECRYTLPNRNNPLYMLMTILGLYGGLIYALRLIIGESLGACRWLSEKHGQIQTETPYTDSMTL